MWDLVMENSQRSVTAFLPAGPRDLPFHGVSQDHGENRPELAARDQTSNTISFLFDFHSLFFDLFPISISHFHLEASNPVKRLIKAGLDAVGTGPFFSRLIFESVAEASSHKVGQLANGSVHVVHKLEQHI